MDTETLLRVIHCLVEGVSVRGTERLTGVHRDTILKLLVIAGEKCERLMGTKVRNVPVADIQCDEIWGYVGKKEQNKWMDESHRKDLGDAYTFVAIERDSKLVLAFHLGRRDQRSTDQFIDKLRTATAPNRFQITTDGFATYTTAIDTALFDRCDYAQLVKVYASPREGEARYSTADVVGAVPTPIMGNPDSDRICTSHVERNNLTMRMQLRRLTRLTNGFSKKWANLRAALSLYFGYYNFCRVHSTIRCTPAMEAGITDHIWTLAELLSYHTT
ncbi:MAG: DDE-type integrase/transposase/recombinase [Acidobacteria bacterium]|nr:DDE-type integrase/transposase/recombinase [Acidobacteriota bacterium]